MHGKVWRHTVLSDGNIIAAAIHDGHEVRPGLRRWLALPEYDRLREEDPFTGALTQIAPVRIVGLRSRFEVDLNRPRSKAVYRTPADAWGLRVWNAMLPERVVRESLKGYDAFYDHVYRILKQVEARHGRFVVYDLHSYCHRRGGPSEPPQDPAANPEVNLGTGTMDRRRWAPIVDRFLADLRAFDFRGRRLDVRENVKFRGGHFSRWIHQTFPRTGCALAIEFKKFFMDEWTGTLYPDEHRAMIDCLRSTVGGVQRELDKFSLP